MQDQAFKRVELWAAVSLVVAFFMPWVSIFGMGFAGFQIGDILTLEKTERAWGYLAYMIPVLACAGIGCHLRLGFRVAAPIYLLTAGAAGLIIYFLFEKLGADLTKQLSVGGWLTMIAALVLVISTLLQCGKSGIWTEIAGAIEYPAPMSLEDFLKFLPHALIIAGLSAILQYVSMMPGMGDYIFPWAVFQTWALYFLSGANPKNGIKSVICGVVGALASILIVDMGTRLVPAMGPQGAFTVAVLVVATLCICMEKVPPINFIPAYFIAAGIFFALGLAGDKYTLKMKLLQVTISLLLGFGLGFITVLLRGKYAAMIAPPAEK